ncbi:MAG: cytochrome P450 [Alphaproteobacteria bacterium]|nr:MAG: cytochrome P450 [Alphaproteobacteria bacterium]
MKTLRTRPTDDAFVQDPYPFYDRVRAAGPFAFWAEYDMAVTARHALVGAILRDRRFGREAPPDAVPPAPDHLRPFLDVERHSMLELEPPRHTRLRGLVVRAFTSRAVAALSPQIEALSDRLIDAFPTDSFDLLDAYARPLPVIVIARLLGIPDDMADQLLAWSNDMVAMYQARRTRAVEDRAVAATRAFVAFLRDEIARKRKRPADDLLSALIAAEADGERLTGDELVTTAILLLNAGHEATVHTLGNGVKAVLEHRPPAAALAPEAIENTVEEILRFDPPLHLFTRWVYEDLVLEGQSFRAGEKVGLLLGGANRDPAVWPAPDRFDPMRRPRQHLAFGAGIHFCVGAPLARLELSVALSRLFARCPRLELSAAPRYANLYHFHGLERLMVRVG